MTDYANSPAVNAYLNGQTSGYLEEAAALLRKAADDNEKSCRSYPDGSGRLNPNRERIAMKFAQLAAIEKGLIPQEMVADLLRVVRDGEVKN